MLFGAIPQAYNPAMDPNVIDAEYRVVTPARTVTLGDPRVHPVVQGFFNLLAWAFQIAFYLAIAIGVTLWRHGYFSGNYHYP